MPNIVAISGTSRPDNYTSRALAVVIDELRSRGHQVKLIDARDLTLSFPGHEQTPDAVELVDAVEAASAVVLASPEYHGSFAAMTKLIIENLGFPSVLRGKPVALLGVAAGRIGAIKSLEQLRGVCAHVGALALPMAVSIAGVRGAFEGDTVTDAGTEKVLRGLATSLEEFLHEYVCPKQALEAIVRNESAPWATQV